MRSRSTLLWCSVLAFVFAGRLWAFKPKTHVWIAQQVLNDVSDGCSEIVGAASCVTIVLCTNEKNGKPAPWAPDAPCRPHEYRVAPDVANALLRHPAEYRAGHIGPDAFPDLVVGQNTAHPGVRGGWVTDDWLRWMLDARGTGDEERAFVFGYLGHAAGDMFAHTYVNTYAGDIFLLVDGETTVERRHVALEDFIDHFTPPIADGAGHPVADGDLLEIPSGFLADRLILNDTVRGEYERPKATAPHLVAMFGVANALEDAIKLTNFADIESPLLDRLREFEAAIKEKGLELDKLASPIEAAKKQIDFANEVLKRHDDAIALQQQLVNQSATALSDLIDQKKRAEEFLASVPGKKSALEGELNRLRNQLANAPATVAQNAAKDICEDVPDLLDPFGVVKRVCHTVTETVQVANAAIKDFQGQIDATNRSLDQLAGEAATAQNTIIQFPVAEAEKQAVKNGAELELKRLQSERLADQKGQKALDAASRELADLEAQRIELTRRVVDLHSSADALLGPLGDVRKIHLFLRQWDADLRKAAAAYMEAGRSAGLSLIVRNNPLAPYSDWISCFAPTFTGIPSPIAQAGCATSKNIGELIALIGQTRKEARDIFGETGGFIVDPLGKLEEEVQKKLEPAVRQAAFDVLGTVGGPEWKRFAQVLTEDFQDDPLNKLFAEDDSRKNLLLIGDIAERVRSDMAVRDDLFDATAFAAVFDAVQMSKLTLLDRAELNRLVADSGVRGSSCFGENALYEDSQANILIGVLSSIDGDHAWNPVAPPRPRRNGVRDQSPVDDRRFGKPKPDGLRIWLSNKARAFTFLGLFRGPLNPGVLGILPSDYEYRPSREIPFPVISANRCK